MTSYLAIFITSSHNSSSPPACVCVYIYILCSVSSVSSFNLKTNSSSPSSVFLFFPPFSFRPPSSSSMEFTEKPAMLPPTNFSYSPSSSSSPPHQSSLISFPSPSKSSPTLPPAPPSSPPPPVVLSPCAACKILRRRCVDKCVLAPYFPPTEPYKFTIAHRVFGASNIIKFLQVYFKFFFIFYFLKI